MKKNLQKSGFISPFIIAGVLFILLPIFTFMTLDRMKKHKEHLTARLLAKGNALIRTFEAGTRTGMLTMRWGARRVQDMLTETSVQPDVAYMMITLKNGRILAHSDPVQVGKTYVGLPDMTAVSDRDKNQPFTLFHRIAQNNAEKDVFEVYKRFSPVRHHFGPGSKMHGNRGMFHNRQMRMMGKAPNMGQTFGPPDWCRPYLESTDDTLPESAEHYIFAGLSMDRAAAAQKKLLTRTIISGTVFSALGVFGMLCLFAFQAYRSTKASLTRVQAFSDNMIEHMPSGLLTFDEKMKITTMNQVAKDILGPNFNSPFPEMTQMVKAVEKDLKPVSGEVLVNIGGNMDFLLDMTASPIKDNKGNLSGFLLLFKDLTQIKHLEKQLETNKRLAAIGKLAAGVAHEIRNPLSSIKGFATYFGKRYEENKEDSETARVMINEVERLNRSVTQLLEFAKPMQVNSKTTDLTDVVSHSLRLVALDLEKKDIHTQINISTENTKVETDPDRVNQILLNLYLNAINAMDEKGGITVEITDTEKQGYIKLMVKDTGAGIEDKDLDRIFDPYFTTRPEGTGLGLAMVHRIVDALGGSITVKSVKGEGTVFSIFFPVT